VAEFAQGAEALAPLGDFHQYHHFSRYHHFSARIRLVENSQALAQLNRRPNLFRGFLQLRSVDPGFRADSVLTAGLTLTQAKYHDMRTRAELIEEVLDKVRLIPGVQSAAVTNSAPLTEGAVVSLGD
jgi:hypothetical protein